MIDFNIRLATLSDAHNILALRNNKQIIIFSHDKKPIPLEAHLEWFKNKLKDSQSALYIAEQNNILIGQTRFDFKKNVYLVSIYIHPDYWGKGIGKRLLLESEQKLRAFKGSSFISEAEVHKENIGSVKLFKNCDYKLYDEIENILIFRKEC